MMRSLVALAAATSLAAAAGCAPNPVGCCDGYISQDEKGVYCIAHKDVVLRFVREPKDPEQRHQRLAWFKTFLKELEPLGDSDALDAKIQSIRKERPEFWKQYSTQHFWAGRDTNLSLDRRGELMKCGFRHGVTQLDAELGPPPWNP